LETKICIIFPGAKVCFFDKAKDAIGSQYNTQRTAKSYNGSSHGRSYEEDVFFRYVELATFWDFCKEQKEKQHTLSGCVEGKALTEP